VTCDRAGEVVNVGCRRRPRTTPEVDRDTLIHMATTKGRAPTPAGDDSHLDERYFIDEHVYNCPFCKRRHVAYLVSDYFVFDWTRTKKCHVYFVRCGSCSKVSLTIRSQSSRC
jgi:hypothetical protein